MNKTNPANFNIELTLREYNLLAKLIYDRSGIDLGVHKKDLLKARLAKRIRYCGFQSFKEYYDYLLLNKNDDEMIEMLNAVSTNVTSFFRETQHFDFLYKSALPSIVNYKLDSGCNRLRLWSAACSSGEEPYTIAMVLLEYMKTLYGWDCKILATDISTKALSLAKEGVYGADKIKSVPSQYIPKYFDFEMDGHKKLYKAVSQLRNLIAFRRLNLISGYFPFKGTFDIIFCRNVMIYFDKTTQEKLINKFFSLLETGGYLFIGHSESLIGTNLQLKPVAPAIYQKV